MVTASWALVCLVGVALPEAADGSPSVISRAVKMDCEWGWWSPWTNDCIGKCGLTTAYKLRSRDMVKEPSIKKCNGSFEESQPCDFKECVPKMEFNGTEMQEAPTKEIIGERKEFCQQQCTFQCTDAQLCSSIDSYHGEWWHDPNWTQSWFKTRFNKFSSEIALFDSFAYPNITLPVGGASALNPSCPWLLPTCTNSTHCDGRPYLKPKVSRIMDNFYHWYVSEAEVSGQWRRGSARKKIPVGGQKMHEQDVTDQSKCQTRCKIWCFEACKCNWGWEFPYSNDEDFGWRYKRPMRYRWVRSEQHDVKPSHGTWKCLSSDNVGLKVPWDNAFWYLDIYSPSVKKVAHQRFIDSGSLFSDQLEFHFVCPHLHDVYSKAICGKIKVESPLNCTRAPEVVITYLHQAKMLRSEYMDSSEERNTLVDTLREGIHKNCRRTCAKSHVPDFENTYPNE